MKKNSKNETCSFIVSQNICVQIPIKFSANVTAEQAGIICGIPEIGPCTPSSGYSEDDSKEKNDKENYECECPDVDFFEWFDLYIP